MIKYNDVLATKELKFPKFKQESKLFERSENITNHARTHKCSSGYCLKERKLNVLFDEDKHHDIPIDKRILCSDGNLRVNVSLWECRMRFGRALNMIILERII
jgi:hypothetical protein